MKKVILFELEKRFYFVDIEEIIKNPLVEMTGFEDLKECEDFLKKKFDYEVKVAK